MTHQPPTNLDDKIVAVIKHKNIEPTPRWHFVIREAIVWVSYVVLIVIGSLSFSVILYLIQTADIELYKDLDIALSNHILTTLPYFWIILIGIFLALAMYNYKHTRKGYKLPVWVLLATNIGASIIIGTVLHITGVGAQFDYTLSKTLPQYQRLAPTHTVNWIDPAHGLLAGEVIELESQRSIRLIDFEGQLWQVDVTMVRQPNRVIIRTGDWVKLIGEQRDQQTFIAFKIRPWEDLRMRSFEPIHRNIEVQRIQFYSTGTPPLPQ